MPSTSVLSQGGNSLSNEGDRWSDIRIPVLVLLAVFVGMSFFVLCLAKWGQAVGDYFRDQSPAITAPPRSEVHDYPAMIREMIAGGYQCHGSLGVAKTACVYDYMVTVSKEPDVREFYRREAIKLYSTTGHFGKSGASRILPEGTENAQT